MRKLRLVVNCSGVKRRRLPLPKERSQGLVGCFLDGGGGGAGESGCRQQGALEL